MFLSEETICSRTQNREGRGREIVEYMGWEALWIRNLADYFHRDTVVKSRRKGNVEGRMGRTKTLSEGSEVGRSNYAGVEKGR